MDGMKILNTMKQGDEQVKINASEVAIVTQYDEATSYSTVDSVISSLEEAVSTIQTGDTETGEMVESISEQVNTLNTTVTTLGESVITFGASERAYLSETE